MASVRPSSNGPSSRAIGMNCDTVPEKTTSTPERPCVPPFAESRVASAVS